MTYLNDYDGYPSFNGASIIRLDAQGKAIKIRALGPTTSQFVPVER
jgi:hypothetical protein